MEMQRWVQKSSEYLSNKDRIEQLDINQAGVVQLVDRFEKAAFQARNLSRAAKIYDRMIGDDSCSIILTLAGSIFSAGLKKIVYQMVENNMVDVIVSTGALMVDQDFFEALGFNHYVGSPDVDDHELMKNHVDRIYDTFISEDDLRVCDTTVTEIADSMPAGVYSSCEFLQKMGEYLDSKAKNRESVLLAAYKREVPVFVPAFSDCSAGFGLILHQQKRPEEHVSIDSVRDFLQLTQIKIAAKDTGLFMIGGGVPKNFAQDIVVASDVLGKPAPMHKFAIQITVADERDGGLSGSTLREAHSWGKVDTGSTQMVFSEATLAFPLIAAYAYQKGKWRQRTPKRYTRLLKGLS